MKNMEEDDVGDYDDDDDDDDDDYYYNYVYDVKTRYQRNYLRIWMKVADLTQLFHSPRCKEMWMMKKTSEPRPDVMVQGLSIKWFVCPVVFHSNVGFPETSLIFYAILDFRVFDHPQNKDVQQGKQQIA